MHPRAFREFDRICSARGAGGRVLGIGAVPASNTLLCMKSIASAAERVGINLDGPHAWRRPRRTGLHPVPRRRAGGKSETSSEQEQATQAFRDHVRTRAPNLHSGIGYGFRAWQAGLNWYEMPESSRPTDASGAAIYDDPVFHLRGAVRLANLPSRTIPAPIRTLGRDRFESVLAVSRALVPRAMRMRLRAWFKRPLESLVDDSRIAWQSERMASEADRLLADPDSYIDHLRRRA